MLLNSMQGSTCTKSGEQWKAARNSLKCRARRAARDQSCKINPIYERVIKIVGMVPATSDKSSKSPAADQLPEAGLCDGPAEPPGTTEALPLGVDSPLVLWGTIMEPETDNIVQNEVRNDRFINKQEIKTEIVKEEPLHGISSPAVITIEDTLVEKCAETITNSLHTPPSVSKGAVPKRQLVYHAGTDYSMQTLQLLNEAIHQNTAVMLQLIKAFESFSFPTSSSQ